METFYKKYVNYIVGILLVICCAKSCKSCSLERELMWNENTYRYEIELLENQVDSLEYMIDVRDDSINKLYYILNIKTSEMKRLDDINNHLKNTNKGLIETTKNLSNKQGE